MENGSSLSASDVAMLTGNNDGFGNGWGGMIWLFAILALMGGGFGGWGNNNFANAIGYENLATSNEVQRGFDNQNIQAQTRDVLSAVNSGTAQSVATANQTFHDSISAMQAFYNETKSDISNIQIAQANALANQNACCCDTKMLIQQSAANTDAQIAQNRYDAALNTASINATTTAQTQKILDAISQNKIEALQQQVNALELQNATSNVLKYPTSWTYNAGMSPFCGYNSNCNC